MFPSLRPLLLSFCVLLAACSAEEAARGFDPLELSDSLDIDADSDASFERWRVRHGAGAQEIIGTDGDDSVRWESGRIKVVFGDGREESFAPSASLVLRLGGGDDDVALADLAVPLAVFVGEGEDTVHAGSGEAFMELGGGDDRAWLGGGGGAVFGGLGDDHVVGSGLDDQLVGGAGHDVLRGLGGDDAIRGDEGDDVLDGGAGDDRLAGLSGRDRVWGGTGDDTIAGGDGDDVLLGDAGHDSIDAGPGDDEVVGGAGDDLVAGDLGDDRLFGGPGVDELHGASGADVLVGGTGDDVIIGGPGRDELRGQDGVDVLCGGADADELIGGDGADRIGGNRGRDLIFSGHEQDPEDGDADHAVDRDGARMICGDGDVCVVGAEAEGVLHVCDPLDDEENEAPQPPLPTSPSGSSGRRDAGHDAGDADAGHDAGDADAGYDAGDADAGYDAGDADAGYDAGDADAGDADAGDADAGDADAGDADAGDADAGWDAGPDAGHDAGHDAGSDAGSDAGQDAGPECTEPIEETDRELPSFNFGFDYEVPGSSALCRFAPPMIAGGKISTSGQVSYENNLDQNECVFTNTSSSSGDFEVQFCGLAGLASFSSTLEEETTFCPTCPEPPQWICSEDSACSISTESFSFSPALERRYSISFPRGRNWISFSGTVGIRGDWTATQVTQADGPEDCEDCEDCEANQLAIAAGVYGSVGASVSIGGRFGAEGSASFSGNAGLRGTATNGTCGELEHGVDLDWYGRFCFNWSAKLKLGFFSVGAGDSYCAER